MEPKTTARRTFGWRPDKPDQRDFLYHSARVLRLPVSVDLRPQMPPVYDQGELGSCTANAVGALVHYERRQQHFNDFIPSRLFLYYNERVLEGTVDWDSGAEIRDGIRAMARWGDVPETEWAYDISQFTVKPSDQIYTDALRYRALRYERITQTLSGLKTALANRKAIAFGFTVYTSFMSASVEQTGVVPMPGRNEKAEGGHAVLLVGYDDRTQRFICRNSWGTGWGMLGYFTMPYAYVASTHLASDFWTITQMEA
jgi:C1A family cysteine protease